jgi:hypothetical protein
MTAEHLWDASLANKFGVSANLSLVRSLSRNSLIMLALFSKSELRSTLEPMGKSSHFYD